MLWDINIQTVLGRDLSFGPLVLREKMFGARLYLRPPRTQKLEVQAPDLGYPGLEGICLVNPAWCTSEFFKGLFPWCPAWIYQ